MNFISLCSGIEAASVAFGPLGWKAIAFSEIEGFPSAVLAHHYPTVRNYGDMSLFRDWPDELFADADAIVGGPPCQAFSVAGARRGLLDARGNLTLIYVELLDHADDIRRKYGKPPIVALYENVPGIFSDRTNAFGCLVGGLAGEDVPVVPPGKRWTDAGCVFGPERAVAWRLFDAQFFALAQRRRRVFVVASARKGFDPATVLFEWDGVRRDTAPSREARQVAPTIPSRSTAGGGLCTDFDCDGGLIEASTHRMVAFGEYRDDGSASAMKARDYKDATDLVVQTAHTLRGEGFDASEDGTGRGTPLVPVAYEAKDGRALSCSPTLDARLADGPRRNQGGVVAFHHNAQAAQLPTAERDTTISDSLTPGDPCHPLAAGAHAPAIAFQSVDHGADASSELSPTIRASDPMAVAQPVVHAIQAGALRVNPASGPDGIGVQADHAYTLEARAEVQAVASVRYGDHQQDTLHHEDGIMSTLPGGTNNNAGHYTTTVQAMQVRRLTPTEAERLQGFQDGYTAIPWRGKPADQCPDGPRYRALGNSWAIPCVSWIGKRIQVEVARG